MTVPRRHQPPYFLEPVPFTFVPCRTSLRHFEDGFDLDGHVCRQRCHTDGSAAAHASLLTEDLDDQLAEPVHHLRLLTEVWCAVHHAEHLHDLHDLVEAAQRVAHRAQQVQSGDSGSGVAFLDGQIGTELTWRRRSVRSPRRVASGEQKVADTPRWHVDANGLRWWRKLDPKLAQPLFRARRLRSYCRRCRRPARGYSGRSCHRHQRPTGRAGTDHAVALEKRTPTHRSSHRYCLLLLPITASTLMATVWSRHASIARYTSPIPPTPIWAATSYEETGAGLEGHETGRIIGGSDVNSEGFSPRRKPVHHVERELAVTMEREEGADAGSLCREAPASARGSATAVGSVPVRRSRRAHRSSQSGN